MTIGSQVDALVALLSTHSTTLLALPLVYLFYILCLRRGPRRAPSRPPRDAKRNYTRGSGETMKCVNPATGEEFGQCRVYTASDVDAASARAKAAQREWATTSMAERKALLMDVSDYILEHASEIISMSVQESGKTRAEASLGEVMTSCEKIRFLCAHGEEYLAPEERSVPAVLAFTKRARVEYRPLGVIAIIVPWNYPYHNILSHVSTALLAGSGAVVKVSEMTSFSATQVEDMFRTLLARRGHSPDLVQIVTGYGQTGAALVRSPSIDKILFIGSPGVGKLIQAGCAENLKPCILELGGKDPFIVFDDVDFNHMVEVAIRGAFINCGQNCIAAERFYVQAGVYDKFVAEITARVKKLRQGASCNGEQVDFGSMTMPRQAEIVDELVKDAVSKGARLISGGRIHDAGAGGTFYAPTVLADVTHEMRIANEETFGPVMTILRFETEEEVVRMANCTDYGLGSSIFTTDYKRADRLAGLLETGMVNVNDFGMVPMVGSLPFGGIKHSGFGAFNGKEGLRGFCRTVSVVTDRFPVRAAAPGFLAYPMTHPAVDKIVEAGVRMVYGKSWLDSIKGALGMAKLIIFGGKKPAQKSAKNE